ncbi:MAG: hypothetical protein OXI39_11285 [Gemmatimonadota bacterium]|uniref:hypothetical protein n=1 Tax=Candidatus Palauibacter scopulicola TaxID=3056741 RepID=UPI0023A1BB13|nr:hypothetical protein [Candidatus Palauibacter scopulicola]MDE2663571.1 hypothetical protein [Candidatus Palauibacter scopulicola]
MNSPTQAPAVILPRSVLADLFHRCASLGEVGVAALKEAGDRTGAEAVALLGDSPDLLSAAEFWAFLDEILRKAGLGSISFKPGGGAFAAIAWRDSPEATSAGNVRCHFATAFLRGVLSRLADRAVEVAEVPGGRGTEPRWFLFGSAETIQRVLADSQSRAGGRER